MAKHDATADAMMRELELLRVSHLQDMERLDAEHQQHLRDEVKRASCSAAESVELAKQQLDAANADMQRLRLHAEELERQLQISVAAASASATAAAVEMHAVRDDAAIRDLEQRLLVAQEESEHVRTENATLHKTINTLTSERDALKVAAERRTAEVTLHATSAIAEELTAIKQELDQSHAQKTQLKEELDAARAQLSVAKMQNESDNALSQQRALQTHAEIELLRIQLTKLQADYDLVQKDNEVLLRKNAKLTEEAAYAGDQSELVQAQQMIEQLELANQQLDADFREKEHEWKAALEAKEREHRQALEKHELEAKRQLQAKEAELAGSMDKKYKGDKDQLAIVRKQLEDKERAIKQITQIQHDVESDYLKRIELLETTAKTATTELDVTKAQLLETQEKMHKLAVDNKAFSDQLGGVASQCEVLTAELAVARAGQERASNNLQEREESFKKVCVRVNKVCQRVS